ncbi:Putative hydroxypyruvate reductase [Labrenzia sp. THAF191b]|uniref:glycerate kinase type-2 family protein n=1 Tax=unclassified Labrenzia TaxID=2648686 RepID=UPI0012695486|nr:MULTISPECIES: glycerate kinase [unclassified Labrenzia]QFS98096.1 Putative hydroxypyruvate reductase [Labrenzia sp. THAF191b]QFT04410.1 Putative hydroxypyruvate reductase [Labrenzia sp. THAF191a]QFT15954.1 Putative hydroxypyruvate reductase [Labrenzia sp. THAF187b]
MAESVQDFLKRLFLRAVEVADPMQSLGAFLPEKPAGRVVVIGAGKASARMAEAVEKIWGPYEGLVITRYGYARPCEGIEIVEAAHPVPDEMGFVATKRMIDFVSGLGENDYVLALMSGGASALLIAPAGEISLAEKQAVNQALLASGAPIGQMNVVRKHLSRVKGGQLAAAAYPAKMLALLISDVPGDNPAEIGSGPTVGDTSTTADAKAILEQWKIEVPASVQQVLAAGSGVLKPDDEKLGRVSNVIFAAPSQSLEAARNLAEAEGCDVEILGDALEGEAREVARAHAELALSRQSERPEGSRPLLLLSGGELTVTRRGEGIGGPNAEYALALAFALRGAPGIHAIACDTDGVDGAAEVAGAVIGPDTLARADKAGADVEEALLTNDAHRFFDTIGDQVVTGPTLTNVNDFRAIWIG